MINLTTFESDALVLDCGQLLAKYLFRADVVPFIFRNRPSALNELSTAVREAFPDRVEEVWVVGSALAGFALSPDNYPRECGDTSDVDIVVVSRQLFDDLWFKILTWKYIESSRWSRAEANWTDERFRQVSHGWLQPETLKSSSTYAKTLMKQVAQLRTTWFACFQSLSGIPEVGGREVSARLYRTARHAVSYHESSLRSLQAVVRNRARRKERTK